MMPRDVKLTLTQIKSEKFTSPLCTGVVLDSEHCECAGGGGGGAAAAPSVHSHVLMEQELERIRRD